MSNTVTGRVDLVMDAYCNSSLAVIHMYIHTYMAVKTLATVE